MGAQATGVLAHSGGAWPSLTHWRVSSGVVAIVVVSVLVLASWWRRLDHAQRSSLVAAILVAALLGSSSVQALSMTSYPAHMIEHLGVILILAPLVARGLAVRLSRPASTLGFLAFTVLVPLYHVSALGAWVMRYPNGHALELVSFFLVGVWFWTPVYSSRRLLNDQQRITYVLLAVPVVATTGLVLWSSSSQSLRQVGMQMSNVTLGDVHTGGVVMMVLGTGLMVAHVGFVVGAAVLRRRLERRPVGRRYAEALTGAEILR